MKWIDYNIEKPTESGFYHVKGKKGTKATMYYYAEAEQWEIGNFPANYFNDTYILWLKEN